MKFDATMYILKLLKTRNPSFTYARIDKFSDILQNYKYDKFKDKLLIGGRKKIKTLSEGSLGCKPVCTKPLGEGSKMPPKFDISKLKIMEDDEEDDVKEFIVNFKSIDYTFNTYHDKEGIHYKLHQSKSDQECIHVLVDKNNKTCEIHNISYDSKCMPKAEMKYKRGKSLLAMAFKLINLIKDKYGLKYVQLTDNSAKYCKNKHRINLVKMSTLTSGLTWYAKYGFIPKDKYHNKDFEENMKIMDKVYLKDIPKIKQYIINAHNKSKSKISLDKILDNYTYTLKENYKLKDFLNKFLLDFDNTCDIFYYFYEQLFYDLKLHDMTGRAFINKL